MQIVSPSVQVLYPTSYEEGRSALSRMELAGRTCYKSEDKATKESAPKFARMILGRQHESVIEHLSATFRIICDRGVSHEIVRHRIASFSQESTRYVNYGKRGVQIISPASAFPEHLEEGSDMLAVWQCAMEQAEHCYNRMIELGAPPELARAVLPNSIKTEIVMTANLREWRHFCKLRCSKKAHPQMREIAIPILQILNDIWPELFEDIVQWVFAENK